MAHKLRPPAWWIWITAGTAVLVLVSCGIILWSFITPIPYILYFAIAAWTLVAFGATWFAFALVGWLKYRAIGWSAVAPFFVVLTLGLILTSTPSKLAFAMSRDTLTATATECPRTSTDRRIGWYTIKYIQPVEHGCLFVMDGGMGDWVGLAYFPDAVPTLTDPRKPGDIRYEKFDGMWFLFTQRL